MERRNQPFDVCIVCALYEEAKAVLSEFSIRCNVSFLKEFSSMDRYEYRYANILNNRREPLFVLVTWLSDSGPTQTGLDLKPFLHEFRPRFVAMAGFCAGYKKKVKRGDLVVAEYAYFYETGKIISEAEGLSRHLQEVKAASSTSQVLHYARGFDGWKEPLKMMKSDRLKRELRNTEEPRCVIAPMASGMAVRQDDPFLWLRERYDRNTVGLDMEAATFYQALRAVSHIQGLVVKGVCDHADMNKNDTYHDYAVRASAVYLLFFIQEYVTEQTMPRRDVPPPSSGAGPPGVWNIPYPRIREHPHNYVPDLRDSLFQAKRGELEQLKRLVIEAKASGIPPCIGIVGMGGIGKTRLALELAYQYEKEQRFPAGIFWMPATGKTPAEWQKQFAQLALRTEYFPSDYAVKYNPEEEEERRARHLCRYLASHSDALLLLDNVEKPELIKPAVSILAGQKVLCTIIYTSRYIFSPPNFNIKTHPVAKLSEESALSLLLGENRPQLLKQIKVGSKEEKAARDICKHVGFLPLALVLLGRLLQDPYLSLVDLYQELKKRGSMQITKEYAMQEAPLFSTFLLSWEKIHDKKTQLLFLLACYLPEASHIPLRFLGSAAGFRPGTSGLEPLGAARLLLQKWSLIEVVSQEEIRLHSVIREFGLQLDAPHKNEYQRLLEESGIYIKIGSIYVLEAIHYTNRSRPFSELDLEYQLEAVRKIKHTLWSESETPLFVSRESITRNVENAYSHLFAALSSFEKGDMLDAYRHFYEHDQDIKEAINLLKN